MIDSILFIYLKKITHIYIFIYIEVTQNVSIDTFWVTSISTLVSNDVD